MSNIYNRYDAMQISILSTFQSNSFHHSDQHNTIDQKGIDLIKKYDTIKYNIQNLK